MYHIRVHKPYFRCTHVWQQLIFCKTNHHCYVEHKLNIMVSCVPKNKKFAIGQGSGTKDNRTYVT